MNDTIHEPQFVHGPVGHEIDGPGISFLDDSNKNKHISGE